MTQSQADLDFVNGLHLMIDSIESSHLQKTEDELPEADHWCPDVMHWHTSDHQPAKAPSVHVNVDSTNGDDPYQSENEVEKSGLMGTVARAAAPAIGEAIGDKISSKIQGDDVEKGEYDQNTNLERHEQENSESSIAEPFLNRYATTEDDEDETNDVTKSNDFVSSVVRTHAKSIDILKIWGSVDRVLPKQDGDTALVDDISILKSFDLDESINAEDLVEGTIVHQMLTNRSTRPTKDWWESSMNIAKSIDTVNEPAFLSAFLYYEPDVFELSDFLSVEKANAVSQDLEMMPNSSGGSAIDGLGMSADGLETGPEDEDCDK